MDSEYGDEEKPSKKLYIGKELLGSGSYKRVYSASNKSTKVTIEEKLVISKPENDEIGIESTENPDNVAVSYIQIGPKYDFVNILNEIEIQCFFADANMAPKIYGVVIRIYNTDEYYKYYGEEIKTITKDQDLYAMGTSVFIFQEKCESDLYKYMQKEIKQLKTVGKIASFVSEIHDNTVMSIIDESIGLGYILLDFKPANICHIKNKNIALDLDFNFTRPYFDALGQSKLFKEHARVYMIVVYYINFCYFYKVPRMEQQFVIQPLLQKENINFDAINNMLLFFEDVSRIFSYMPKYVLIHYIDLFTNLKNYNISNLMDDSIPHISEKICEILFIEVEPEVGVGIPSVGSEEPGVGVPSVGAEEPGVGVPSVGVPTRKAGSRKLQKKRKSVKKHSKSKKLSSKK
jgi:hypothetical protein